MTKLLPNTLAYGRLIGSLCSLLLLCACSESHRFNARINGHQAKKLGFYFNQIGNQFTNQKQVLLSKEDVEFTIDTHISKVGKPHLEIELEFIHTEPTTRINFNKVLVSFNQQSIRPVHIEEILTEPPYQKARAINTIKPTRWQHYAIQKLPHRYQLDYVVPHAITHFILYFEGYQQKGVTVAIPPIAFSSRHTQKPSLSQLMQLIDY